MEDVAPELDSNGAPAYRWFAAHWTDENRLPLFIQVDGEIVGYSLIRKLTPGWSEAEFTVRADWRERRVGLQAVEAPVAMARASSVQ